MECPAKDVGPDAAPMVRTLQSLETEIHGVADFVGRSDPPGLAEGLSEYVAPAIGRRALTLLPRSLRGESFDQEQEPTWLISRVLQLVGGGWRDMR